ncbi:MAG: SMC-Scp complex subunit ScpB [Clostridium sp.]|nr:SMC-Scp complex subunit ScpB [Clostridium sp.]
MDEREKMGLIETILFVSGEALPVKRVAGFLDMSPNQTEKLLDKLSDTFNFERRGLQIIKVNDCYQLATRPEYGEYIENFFGTVKKQTLSQSVLETLAIIAYRQPITRMDIELIRGVRCEYTLGVLLNKGLVKEVSRLDAPGKPILYGTTDIFLKTFGFSSLDELPPVDEELQ